MLFGEKPVISSPYRSSENQTKCSRPSCVQIPVPQCVMYLWWSLYTLYLLACQVRVTAGDSGLCCWACDVFQVLINFHVCDFPSACICVCLCMCVHVFVCTKFGSERVFLSDLGFLVPTMTVVSGW